MGRLIDAICRIRDVLENKNYKKLAYCRRDIQTIFDEVHRNIRRKTMDYKYKLDFTAQDLRELAQNISDTFKRWDGEMNPEKNIKKILKEDIIGNTVNFEPYITRITPVMEYRRDYAQVLTELRSLMEHHATYLYFLEEASKDEIALKYTERFH